MRPSYSDSCIRNSLRGHRDSHRASCVRARAQVSRIWGAVWHRRDIGTAESIAAKVSHMRSVRGPRIGIVGSTRGTNTLHIYEEIAQGRLQAEVAVVVSNVADAIILERATKAGVPAIHIGSKGRKRAEFDAELNAVLQKHGCDIVLLVGFMRILSPVFCKAWAGRAVNVHPSLLPAHAGLMDLAVHESVLAAGDQRSGCTVHLVEEVVDAVSVCAGGRGGGGQMQRTLRCAHSVILTGPVFHAASKRASCAPL
jgi:phosphoribosylglycinamide formyltransferase-1